MSQLIKEHKKHTYKLRGVDISRVNRVWYADRASQYGSHIHTGTLKQKGITISMGGKACATDNICIERF